MKLFANKFFLIIFISFSCSKKNDPASSLISPFDANKLSAVIITPDGGQTKQGQPPLSSAAIEVLTLTTRADASSNGVLNSPTSQTVQATQGSQVNINCYYVCKANNCESLRAGLKASGTPYCIYRIKNSDSYKVYPYPKSFGNSGTLNFPFSLPENINSGEFEVEFSIVDEYGLVTNYNSTRVNVKRLEDKDNPAKAFGCNFEKATNELITILNSLTLGTPAGCENFKKKYNELVIAMINCNEIPATSKAELKKANDDLQALDCSGLGKADIEPMATIMTKIKGS
jgi:hypothetical protein